MVYFPVAGEQRKNAYEDNYTRSNRESYRYSCIACDARLYISFCLYCSIFLTDLLLMMCFMLYL